MIDISYIEDEVEPPHDDPVETVPRLAAPMAALGGVRRHGCSVGRPLRHRVVAHAAPDRLRSADGVGVGQVYTVGQRFGSSWLRITEITLTAATPGGDPAALFVVEGRGWLPQQQGTLTAQVYASGDVSTVGTWTVDGSGGFRFADTDPGGGNYLLTIDGLEHEPVRVLIGPSDQRVLGPLERGCPQLA